VLLTGAKGQLGHELIRSVPTTIELKSFTRSALDITNLQAVRQAVIDFRPDWIVNAAAYTQVDRAEDESELAYAVNRDGSAHLAHAARDVKARLVQVSTDFVFDGGQGAPYRPEDPVRPLGVYGASKYAGEEAVRDVLGDRALVLRTAWLYSVHGANFVKTLLRLMRERESVRVVADQVGTPTWARGLAEVVWRAIETGISGMHHWTDAGVASWYDFAAAIQEEGLVRGLLTKAVPIEPIPTASYPTRAKRPSYSVLDKSVTWEALGVRAEHWRAALRGMLDELVASGKRQ
jgi:dTDP-4-dehydrorhamnose reductase